MCTDASGLSDVSTIVSFDDTMVIGSFEWNVREERSLSIQKQYETYIFASDLSSAKKYVSDDDVSPKILIPGAPKVCNDRREYKSCSGAGSNWGPDYNNRIEEVTESECADYCEADENCVVSTFGF